MNKEEFQHFLNRICRIEFYDGVCGVGFYYGSNWVVTCAHVLQDCKNFRKNVTFTFQESSSDKMLKITGDITSYAIHKVSQDDAPDDTEYDIAFLMLPEDLSIDFLDFPCNWFQTEENTVKIGYVVRAVYWKKRNKAYVREHTFCEVKDLPVPGQILQCFTVEPEKTLPAGSSGCPILMGKKETGLYYLVGLHYAGTLSSDATERMDLVINLSGIINHAAVFTTAWSLAHQYEHGNFNCGARSPDDDGQIPEQPPCDDDRADIIKNIIKSMKANNLDLHFDNEELNEAICWAQYKYPKSALLVVKGQEDHKEIRIYIKNEANNGQEVLHTLRQSMSAMAHGVVNKIKRYSDYVAYLIRLESPRNVTVFPEPTVTGLMGLPDGPSVNRI